MKRFEAGHQPTSAPARATFSMSSSENPMQWMNTSWSSRQPSPSRISIPAWVSSSKPSSRWVMKGQFCRGALVLDLDAVAPLQVEGGALVGQGVGADQPHGQAREERLVPLVREVVVGGHDAREEVLVRAEQVAVLRRDLRPLDLEQVGGLEILLPVRPVQVVLAGRGADAREVVAVEVVVEVDQGREGRVALAEADVETRRGTQPGDAGLVDLERPRGDDRIGGDDREAAQRVRSGHWRSFVSNWMNTIV